MSTESAQNTNEQTLVFLLDVDNTLLDNDRIKFDLAERIEELIGPERARRFWEIYEEVRHEQDFVDFPTTVSRLAKEYQDPETGRWLNRLLDTWPFRSYLYPHVLETMDYLKRLGKVVILSDGDSVFQPLKIRNSGLEEAADGNVLVYVHKEAELPKVFARYPANHYVVVDDKPRIIAALEQHCPSTFTTVLVLQGKYAHDNAVSPKPDYVTAHIADLRNFTRAEFLAVPQAGTSTRS
jgi:FMN phosphatase YigB (HAD superfamily)